MKVVLIYSQDEESRMVASRFQMLTDDSDIQVKISFRFCFFKNYFLLATKIRPMS